MSTFSSWRQPTEFARLARQLLTIRQESLTAHPSSPELHSASSAALPSLAVLEARDLHLWRGDRHVLRGVSFRVEPGECLQITGSNGAGKSSLLRTLCGLMYPEEGQVLWNSHSIRRRSAGISQ